MMIWIIITSILFVSGVSNTKSRNLLTRHKRWDNNGDMNNNGDMSNMFRGTAGVDYPNYNSIPTTSFRCDDQIYEGGLYADVEAQCQVYHVCHDGRKDSFLCGRGTIFNQEILACDYWYSTECDKAPSFYYVNQQIGNSGSSWVPPSGGHQVDNPSNFQDASYRPNNNGQGGGYSSNDNGQSGGFGSNNNGQGGGYGSNDNGQSGGFGSNNNGQGGGYGSNNNGQSGGFGSNNNGQGGGYVSNNNGQGGGFDPNNYGQGGGSNNNGQSGGFGSNNNGQNGDNNKEDCCCQKYSYKTPWEFPAS